jgi:CheY-like chemotaxis protein
MLRAAELKFRSGGAMSYVLVVEDDAKARRLLCRFLEPFGYLVIEAGSAEQAVGYVTGSHPDVAFCDVHMPGANGLWLADQIRSLSSTTAIVLATGDWLADVTPLCPVPVTERSGRRGLFCHAGRRFSPEPDSSAAHEPPGACRRPSVARRAPTCRCALTTGPGIASQRRR